jgi:hypothetical protein
VFLLKKLLMPTVRFQKYVPFSVIVTVGKRRGLGGRLLEIAAYLGGHKYLSVFNRENVLSVGSGP